LLEIPAIWFLKELSSSGLSHAEHTNEAAFGGGFGRDLERVAALGQCGGREARA
jgi:hypothetical protein